MNPLFDANYYLSTNPDVRAMAGTTPQAAWLHYITWGANEAFILGGMTRRPNPYFDVRFYLYNPNNEDLWRSGASGGVSPSTALDHYYTHGRREGRAPNASAAGT